MYLYIEKHIGIWVMSLPLLGTYGLMALTRHLSLAYSSSKMSPNNNLSCTSNTTKEKV